MHLHTYASPLSSYSSLASEVLCRLALDLEIEAAQMPVRSRELSEGATLHLIGPRRKSRVILFYMVHHFPQSPTWVCDVDVERNNPRDRLGGGYVILARVVYMLESLHEETRVPWACSTIVRILALCEVNADSPTALVPEHPSRCAR